MAVNTIEDYELKEARLEKIKDDLESMRRNEKKIDVRNLIELRDEAQEIGNDLKVFLEKTFK